MGNEASHKKTLTAWWVRQDGSHVARVARAMGMEVVAYDPFVSADVRATHRVQVKLLPLAELFAEADYMSFHLPRTPDTKSGEC